MRRTRQVIAVMLVTTALCADRGAAALSVSNQPQSRTHADDGRNEPRGSFFQRLTRTLVGRVSVVLQRQSPAAALLSLVAECVSADRSALVPHQPTAPFQFRLPPPTC